MAHGCRRVISDLEVSIHGCQLMQHTRRAWLLGPGSFSARRRGLMMFVFINECENEVATIPQTHRRRDQT